MPTITGIDVLNSLTEERKRKYKDSILIIAEEFKSAQKLIGNKMIYDYIIQGTNKNELLYKVNRIIKERHGRSRKR